MSAFISQDDLYQFENLIYLPMVLKVFEKDKKQFEVGSFKFKGPYLQIVDAAIKIAQNELQTAKTYAREHRLKLEQRKLDEFTTEYIFYYNGFRSPRRYMNLRLRNRTEELIRVYLQQATVHE